MARPGSVAPPPTLNDANKVVEGQSLRNLSNGPRSGPARKKLTAQFKSRDEDCGNSGSACDKTDSDSSISEEVHSETDMPRGNICEEEAVSSLAAMIAANDDSKNRKRSSLSARNVHISSGSTSPVNGDGGADPTVLKKQRRREKNRASAQQSRQRKKIHLESLEVRVDALEGEKKSLLWRLESLNAENAALKAKLQSLVNKKEASEADDEDREAAEKLNALAETAHEIIQQQKSGGSSGNE
ncbi:hypothetical protein GUITHDRAFT_154451 [Guillardia theta CCMP2712]|uniref:BZIP domain-containing protein n=1 Tax=Guillardia theta (strain CCMP2712) TaxID=905079 RepID=L1ITX4_GUITC|nr:hypothetical protein GUITHDRAFT_154451 [Guillardia theta CCMP2712]EKX39319.1 hypothetical protein GUITHDRAFT_154451 [Guillardia theta CCMP2712]|eukprot:XP_005826299.1 hypothetical protein GUITHDRAFT_154451 [Guillardia theta CCMP2712]